jgi:hypothetical protein
MTPTNKLRFVKRQINLPDFYVNPNTMKPVHQTIEILQQWWTVTGTLPEFQHQYGEWRDVPTEQE